MDQHNSLSFPLRINVYLARTGVSSRREADELITQGLVHINNKIAHHGDKVEQSDTVTVSRKIRTRTFRYYAYHKPAGVVTHSPQLGEKDIIQATGLTGLYPIGRLDKDTTGLILLTDDRRITDSVLNPKFEHEKEYRVTVGTPVSDAKLRMLGNGIKIERYRTKPARIKRIGEKSFFIALVEGKKHQIRRMCASIGAVVSSLARTRFMHISLGSLKKGTFRPLTQKEVTLLLSTYTQNTQTHGV